MPQLFAALNEYVPASVVVAGSMTSVAVFAPEIFPPLARSVPPRRHSYVSGAVPPTWAASVMAAPTGYEALGGAEMIHGAAIVAAPLYRPTEFGRARWVRCATGS